MSQEKMLRNYTEAQKLQSWADLFWFQLEMGRVGGVPYITVDGMTYENEDVEALIKRAGSVMGMDEVE